MNLPKMIIFDYGHTLLYEAGFDGVKGTEAVLHYAIKNKSNLTAEQVNSISGELFKRIGKHARSNGLEIHNHMFQKTLYEYVDIELSISPSECEEIFWTNAAPGETMPNVIEMLDYLETRGIRSGVISNICFSGESLRRRINSLLPNNKFEFILASSEYVFRKPAPIMFEIALKKASLLPNEVWYCGDNTQVDILGASSLGIMPVWYQNSLECSYREKEAELEPECEHIHIKDWLELINMLRRL